MRDGNINGSPRNAATASTPNALNQLTNITTAIAGGPTTTANLTYDAAGNLTQRAAPNGTNKTTYTYDDADRLTRIERRGDTGQLLTVSEFGYDYASRRAFTREYDFANGGWAKNYFRWLNLTKIRNLYHIRFGRRGCIARDHLF